MSISSTRSIQIIRKGFEATDPFPVRQLCSSATLGWQDVNLAVYETGVLADWSRVEITQDHVVSLLLEGGGRLFRKLNGREHTHDLRLSDFEVLPLGHSAENRWMGGTHTNAHLHVRDAALRRVCAETFGANPDHIELVNHFPLLSDALFSGIARALWEELKSGGQARLYVDTLAESLIAYVLRHHTNQPLMTAPLHYLLPDSALRRVRDYIGDNLAQALTLADIAAQAGLSPFHLSRLFKRATGCSLHQYVIAQRVERAKQLLLAGHMPLKEIAQRVGFADQSHLTRQFRRVVGVTPHALRGEMRKNVLGVDRNLQDE